jgi:hypothetical protein
LLILFNLANNLKVKLGSSNEKRREISEISNKILSPNQILSGLNTVVSKTSLTSLNNFSPPPLPPPISGFNSYPPPPPNDGLLDSSKIIEGNIYKKYNF